MYYLEFNKTIINVNKLSEELKVLTPKFVSYYSKGDYVQIAFSSNLIQSEVDAVSNKINTFVEVSITEQLKEYVETEISPFIRNLLFQIQAENISMGITQLGKTGEVLGFFEDRILLPNRVRAISLKASLDTNSLTETIALLTHYIDNPNLYSDLSPFITADRLTDMRTKVMVKL